MADRQAVLQSFGKVVRRTMDVSLETRDGAVREEVKNSDEMLQRWSLPNDKHDR